MHSIRHRRTEPRLAPASVTHRISGTVALLGLLSTIGCPPLGAQTLEQWAVVEAPLVRIGSIEGPEASQFDQVRSVAWFDGSMVVADRGSNQIRFFDDRGAHLRTVGGEGDAPGEFRGLANALPYRADSLYAFDFISRRITLFDNAGGPGRTVGLRPPPSVDGRGEPVGWLPDGSWIVAIHAPDPIEGDVTRSTLELWRYAPEGAPVERISSEPGRESARSSDGTMSLELILPWARQTVVRHDGALTYIGDNGTNQVRGTRARGTRARADSADASWTLSLPGEAEPFGEAVLESYVRDRVDQSPRPDAREMIEEMFRSVAHPERLPWYDRIRTDDRGNTWVRRFKVPGAEIERWEVFARDRHIASVELPPFFEVHDIVGDRLLGVRFDEFGVEYVEMLELLR